MKKLLIAFIIVNILIFGCYGIKIRKVPFDSSMHIGLSSGLGLGIGFGADILFPVAGMKIGIEFEQLVNNVSYEQNISVTKYGLIYKQFILSELFLTLHGGASYFVVPRALSYNDFTTGQQYNIPDNFRGTATYIGVGLNYKMSDYIITPKISLNSIADGGNLLGIDINIGHKL